MQNVGAAILAAQAIVCSAGIEKRDPGRLRRAGHRQQLRRRQVGNDEPDALCRELAEAHGDIAVLRYDCLGQRERLAGEMAGRVVVGNAEPRALDASILPRLVEVGERQCPLHRPRQPPDLHHFLAGRAGERKLAEDGARPIIFYPRGGTCSQPYVKGLVTMVNSIYNGYRMEDVWLDK
jgi:hypothetical protein